MAKYLDQTGLTYLWGKIKENFTNEIEIVKVNGTALTIDSADKSVNVVIPAATVTGVKSGDKVLSMDGTELKSTLDLVYDSSAKTIYLNGISGQEIAHIDATDFIKDGMLDSVELSGNSLIFTFNTESGKEVVSVDLSKFIDVYTSGNGIDINGQVISVKLAEEQGNAVLSFDEAGGLKAAVDLSAYALTADMNAADGVLSGRIDAVQSALSAETEARAAAITAVESAVSVEAAARAAAITDVESAISVEENARKQAISDLESAMNLADGVLSGRIDAAEEAISAEENARKQAISALSSAFDEALDELESAYTAADRALGARIDAAESAVTVEAAARAAAIAAVESAYTHADAALDGRLDLLEGSATTWNNAGGFAVKAEGAEVAGYDHNQSAETFVDLVAGSDMAIGVTGNTIEIACTIEALSNADIDAAISGSTL